MTFSRTTFRSAFRLARRSACSFAIPTTIALALAFAFASALALPASAQTTQRFVNARWFDGTTFRAGDRYVVDGRFVANRPKRIDQTTDLHGAYVVPPFGEAHTHNVESTRFDAVAAMHLKAGVFYVKNPNGLKRFTTPIMDRVNVRDGLDVSFAHGGLTGSGGHPVAIAQRQIARGSWTPADGDGGFYWIVDDLAMLDAKWPRILSERPDFIKTYLLYSEEYAKRSADSTYHDWRGLNPALLPEIVKRAHAAGKRVSTHVETAQDFRNAVAGGTDEINHLPGFRPERNDPTNYEPLSRYVLTDDDARRAARAHITVVTTVGGVVELVNHIPPTSPQAALAARTLDVLRENLRVLQRNGVRIAIGSDEYSRTTDFEVEQLVALRAVDNLTLLKWWVENTPATIFPSRKLGHLASGYEASFLVLDGNPLDDFANSRKITMRVKQGVTLGATSTPATRPD